MASVDGEIEFREKHRPAEGGNISTDRQEEPLKRMSSDMFAYGTDIEVETPCGPCLYADEKSIESVAYCLECVEYLCENCRSQHRRLKVTRSHRLMDIGDSIEEGDDANATEACPEHYGRQIDHFCENHQVLCCKSCVSIGHKMCIDVKFIPNEVTDIKSSQELKECKENLDGIVKRFEKLKQFKVGRKTIIDKQRTFALQQVEDLMLKVNAFYDKLGQDSTNEIKQEHETITNELSNDEESYQAVMETLQVTKDNLGTVVRCASKSQVFITMKRALQQTQKYSDYLTDIETNLKEINMSFKEDETFQAMFNKVTAVGRVLTNTQLTKSAMKATRSSSLSFKRKKAIPIGGHSVRVPDDRTTCFITGSVFLDDGRLVLADYNNKSIKLFDINCKFADQKVLSSRPNDITVVRHSEIATSLVDKCSILFMNIDNKLNVAQCVKTETQYIGIACSKGSELFASCNFKDGSGEIHVLDLNCNVIRTIGNTRKSTPTFIRPTSIMISNDGNFLYVVDIGQNSVVCVDVALSSTNSRVVYNYTDKNLELRSGITMDSDGSIYVSSGNMSIHQISFTGVKIHEILTAKDGLGQPHCLSFSPKNNKLVVAEFKENSIKIFKLI